MYPLLWLGPRAPNALGAPESFPGCPPLSAGLVTRTGSNLSGGSSPSFLRPSSYLVLLLFRQQLVSQRPQSRGHFLFQPGGMATVSSRTPGDLVEMKVRRCLSSWCDEEREFLVIWTMLDLVLECWADLSAASFVLLFAVTVVDEAQLQVSVVVQSGNKQQAFDSSSGS